MTFHAAITYFDMDDRPAGYVLGADSRVINTDHGTQRIVYRDKSFFGRNLVGFLRGTLLNAARHGRITRALDDVFDGIEDGESYADVPTLRDSKQYSVLLAKRDAYHVSLFMVSNRNRHCAQQLHTLTRTRPLRASQIWFSAEPMGYRTMSLQRLVRRKEAQDLVDRVLREGHAYGPQFNPGKPSIYAVSFDAIRKLA